jgi:hypothetical protein
MNVADDLEAVRAALSSRTGVVDGEDDDFEEQGRSRSCVVPDLV